MLSVFVYADPDCTPTVQTTERAANAVELKFYRTLTDAWTSEDNSAKVAVRVANQANAYCGSNPAACGLEACCTSEFKDVSVGVQSGYPQLAENEKDLLLKVYVDFPSSLNGSGSLQCVLGASTVREILGNVRQNIFDDTGSWITYVDEVFYGIPPDHQLNAIIIPIAIVIVLGIVIAALILHFWNKRREDVARRQRIIEKRKERKTAQKTARVTPTVQNDANLKSDKPRRKNEAYKANLLQQNKTMQKTSSFHSEDSAIKLDNEPRQRKSYGYDSRDQTYADGATGYGKPIGTLHPIERAPEDDTQLDSERKKKKKHKKHKKHKQQEEFENQAYDDSGTRDY